MALCCNLFMVYKMGKFKYFETNIQGGCFFEFQRGKWDGKSHWKSDSLYLYADVFDGLGIYPVFANAFELFNYYGPNEVTRDIWDKIVLNSRKTGGETAALIDEAIPWAEENFLRFDVFYMLGI